jgi:non-ribosomal peptide synthetase component F
VWGGLLNSATVVILPKQTVIDPFALRDSLQQHGITTMFMTTALFNLTAQACHLLPPT